MDKINVAMAVVLIAATSAFGQADEKERRDEQEFRHKLEAQKKAAESAATPE